ncbi:MAG: hypothetical protein NTY38_07700 [Acidobacteria bacterium]|nr:hypothetical protein [Acidobacteriota bacterium]
MALAQALTPLPLEITRFFGAAALIVAPEASAPELHIHSRLLIIATSRFFAKLTSMKFVLIGLMLLLASLSFPAEKKRKPKGGPDIEVIELSCHRTGLDVVVDGRVRNSGDKSIEGLKLLFDFLGTSGAVISTREGGIEDAVFEPDTEAEFHARIPDPVRAVRLIVNAQTRTERELRVGNPGPYVIE